MWEWGRGAGAIKSIFPGFPCFGMLREAQSNSGDNPIIRFKYSVGIFASRRGGGGKNRVFRLTKKGIEVSSMERGARHVYFGLILKVRGVCILHFTFTML